MKMSKRDKYLLLGVLIIAIWALGIMFFVKPQMEENKTVKSSLSVAESELSSLEIQADAAAGMKNAASSRYEEVKSSVDNKFYQPMRATELLDQLDKLFTADEITIGSQTLSNLSSVAVVGYATTDSTAAIALESDAELQTDSSATDSSSASSSSQATTVTTVNLYTITVSYESTYGKLQEFMAHLKTNDKKSMYISTVTIDGMDDSDKNISEFTDSTKVSGSMTLMMYAVPELQDITFD